MDYRLLIISHLQNYCYGYEVHSSVRLLASFPRGLLPDQEGFNPLVLMKKKNNKPNSKTHKNQLALLAPSLIRMTFQISSLSTHASCLPLRYPQKTLQRAWSVMITSAEHCRTARRGLFPDDYGILEISSLCLHLTTLSPFSVFHSWANTLFMIAPPHFFFLFQMNL